MNATATFASEFRRAKKECAVVNTSYELQSFSMRRQRAEEIF
jgi:hypothetical protein